jgi:hypothetical protein
MISRLTRILAAFALLALGACGGNGGSSQDDAGDRGDAQLDGAINDAGQMVALGLGEPCTCTGTDCAQMQVPKPAGGTIAGCEQVATDVPGAALVCLRSYGGDLATKTYFANGYCGLMATTCTGADLICTSAVYGDYATMTACPAGSVMLQDSQDVDVIGQQATVKNKLCAKICTSDADCRSGEIDPVLSNETSQYRCIDKGGVKFCDDPRNLSSSYTAAAF